MPDKHPYISATGNLVKAIKQFRASLPAKIDAAALRKLGIAPRNESYLINILRYLNVIGEGGAPTDEGRTTFTQHGDEAFGAKLSEMIERAYSELFSLHNEGAWQLNSSALITYFRQSDQTSSVVGDRQAATFRTLAALAGHGSLPTSRPSATRKGKPDDPSGKARVPRKATSRILSTPRGSSGEHATDFGLTVRIEINLPTADDQDVYDRIFRSIKENLLNG